MALLGLLFALLGVIWGLLALILDLLGLTLGVLGRSWGSPGTLWGASGELLEPPKASQIAPGGSPGGPPHRSLIFEAFWERFWLHFGTPRTSKNMVFVWKVLHFQKNRFLRFFELPGAKKTSKKPFRLVNYEGLNGEHVKSFGLAAFSAPKRGVP